MATATKKPSKAAAKRAANTPKSRLRFRTAVKDDGTIHWYELDGNRGKLNKARQRGVTTILGAGTPSGGLMQWAANAAADCALDQQDVWRRRWDESGRKDAYDYIRSASNRLRDEAAGRGTDVHNFAEKLMRGETIDAGLLANHVDRFIEWHELWEPEIYAVELVGANFTRNYFGKFDILAGLRGWWPDRPDEMATILIDIKTGEKGPYEKDALQLAAYANFEEVGNPNPDGWVVGESGEGLDPMPHVDGTAVLKITENAAQLFPVNPELQERLFATFLHVSRVAEFYGSSWGADDKGWCKDALLDPITTPHGATT